MIFVAGFATDTREFNSEETRTYKVTYFISWKKVPERSSWALRSTRPTSRADVFWPGKEKQAPPYASFDGTESQKRVLATPCHLCIPTARVRANGSDVFSPHGQKILAKLLCFVTRLCTTSSARLIREPKTFHQLRRLGEDEEVPESDRKFGARALRGWFRCGDGAGVPQAVRCLLRHLRDEGLLIFSPAIFLSLFGCTFNELPVSFCWLWFRACLLGCDAWSGCRR
jgi:hypothetical protein